ncbi:hypothetical protein SLEP1_g55950 [Rubroshorea leprosula]|uniref:Leucine-rich repeat-containing N-terminal plant-type domain-containing protein n=1 Tax=Rubroshorea leprosula TaxID=152421 RepID=A0AAV5MH38_9ROSI|nr:hypothetical protein SLEP1_g55950 [Rubroshorea leprosula]
MGRLIWFSQILCLSFMLQFRVQSSSPSQSSLNSPPHLCHPEEHSALLDFKSTTNVVEHCFVTPRPIIQTWNESKDCCLWEGITCDRMKGHVMGLDLSSNCLEANLTTNSSLFRLEKLQSLNLSDNYFHYPNISFGFDRWKSLTYLNLSNTGYMDGSLLFDEIFLLTKLVSLDLSDNYGLLLDNIKFQMLVHNLTELRFLILDSVNMSLVVPSSLLNLTSSLKYLSLSDCNLQGNFPNQVFQLPSLRLIDLTHNHYLRGNLLESNWSSTLNFGGEIPSSISNLTHLTFLSLSSNKLLGRVPSWLFSLPSLSHLDLRNNRLTGPIDHVEMPNLILQEVYLSYNEISGSIPSFFFHLVNLSIIDLSSNNLSGTITPSMLLKLVDLEDLDLSNNSLLSLSNNGTAVNYSFPNLQSLRFSSCNIHKFPSFLRKAENLQELDISKNKISGQIHKWEVEGMSLSSLDLSYNFLTGIDLFCFGYLEIVDLRSNLLQGSLPILSTTWDFMRVLLVSGNNLTGEIPSSYCNLTSLRVLDLANNRLGGKIPECLGNLSDLSILDLGMNKFHGRIPNSFVNNSFFRTLKLNGNQLEGRLPSSLVNCSQLEVLDVENNRLNDSFPQWLGVLPRLRFLILRFNLFHGAISNSMPAFYFSQLRIIDVSHNNFTGLEVRLARIFKSFTTIDFSSNRFHGQIPEELGELNSLLLLNLSHNSLTGGIPSSLGKMTILESLDLSSNKLEGRIPEQLTNLTFLSVLKLSHNELVGHIPEGKQFNTFSNDSYIGNSGLCGFPLTKKCHKKEEPGASPSKFHEEYDSTALFEWKFALAGHGCGLVLGLSLGYIMFTTGKPWWVVKKVEKYQQKFVGTSICRHKKRKTQKSNQHS